MKLLAASFLLSLAPLVAAAAPNQAAGGVVFSGRLINAECTGYRLDDEKCTGKMLAGGVGQPLNCKEMNGKCCALDKNGKGGFMIEKGTTRFGPCEFCFSGGCQKA